MEFKKYKKIEYIEKRPRNVHGKMPTLIYLHGAGTRQADLEALTKNQFYEDYSVFSAEDSEFLCFTPLCYANSWFDIFEQLQDFVNAVSERDDVDSERLYLMGSSMGGYAAWQLAMTMPDTFAAMVPICGGGMYWNVWELHKTYVWAFHGLEDDCVSCEESKKMVNAINSQENNLKAKLTLLENVRHDSWIAALSSREVYNWLLSKKKIRGEANDSEKVSFADIKKYG